MPTCDFCEGGGHKHDLGALLKGQALVQLWEAQVVADCHAQSARWAVACYHLQPSTSPPRDALVGGISNAGGSESRCHAEVVEQVHLAPRRSVAAFQQDWAVRDVYIEEVHLCAQPDS